jgi:hypothetical protein
LSGFENDENRTYRPYSIIVRRKIPS